ncbi:hypothetical protein B0H14DRAFT_3422199 [Mycena olivaceomarginata]|nr:hypothetical protein B0H14DRAFT_3422199 [Mycena olivaceomarginata]
MRATGTGVVVDAGPQDKDAPKFAMGAEPQILPGEKRGPLGTGSETIKGQIGGDTTDAKNQLRGAVGEAKGQMQSFRQSVDEKAAMEKKNPGWKSAAFDI